MKTQKIFLFGLIWLIVLTACDYIVLPEELEEESVTASGSWAALVTGVSTTEAGDLRIDITLRNDTGDWSAMQADQERPAVLSSGGETTDCETVFVSTGGHRLAPGFQMRGYIGGTKAEPQTQMLHVECSATEVGPGTMLTLNYSYVTGEYNYYEPDANKAEAVLELNLDEIAEGLDYPIAAPVDGLAIATDTEMIALNECILTLTSAERTETGLRFNWLTTNPGEYPTYVHIGTPPVIGTDGIIYGLYESPDIVSVPVVPGAGNAEWSTEVAVPADVSGLYVLLSVESKKQRLFVNYAVDVTDY